MRKKKIGQTITEIRMIERYKQINKFRYSIFQITNPAMPNEVLLNPILATIVLDKLRELRGQIRGDIKNITIDNIKAEDIFGKRESEVSELFANEICLYDFSYYKRSYDKYLKGEALQRICPTHKKERIIETYNEEINALEETVNDLETIDKQLAKEERKKLESLKLQKQEFEEKFDFPTLEQIEISLFNRVHSYLNNIIEDVENKIEYLEGKLGDRYE